MQQESFGRVKVSFYSDSQTCPWSASIRLGLSENHKVSECRCRWWREITTWLMAPSSRGFGIVIRWDGAIPTQKLWTQAGMAGYGSAGLCCHSLPVTSHHDKTLWLKLITCLHLTLRFSPLLMVQTHQLETEEKEWSPLDPHSETAEPRRRSYNPKLWFFFRIREKAGEKATSSQVSSNYCTFSTLCVK